MLSFDFAAEKNGHQVFVGGNKIRVCSQDVKGQWFTRCTVTTAHHDPIEAANGLLDAYGTNLSLPVLASWNAIDDVHKRFKAPRLTSGKVE